MRVKPLTVSAINQQTKTTEVFIQYEKGKWINGGLCSDASLELRQLLEQNEFEPPTLFIELLELAKDKQNESVWRETSRWIKFEENVDQGGARWSKAHVGTISISVMKKVQG